MTMKYVRIYDEPDPIGAIGFAWIIGVIVACNYIWETLR